MCSDTKNGPAPNRAGELRGRLPDVVHDVGDLHRSTRARRACRSVCPSPATTRQPAPGGPPRSCTDRGRTPRSGATSTQRAGYDRGFASGEELAVAEVEIGLGKSGRRAYGFDDIAIVPSRRTRDPEDVDISWEIDGLPVRAAAAGLGHGRRGVAGHGHRDRPPRGRRGAQPRGPLDPLRGPRAATRGDLQARRREGHRAACRTSTCEPIKPELVTERIRQIRDAGSRVGGVGHAAAHRPAPARHPGRRARHARHPGHGRVGRARLEEPRAAEPAEGHPRASRCR